MNRHETDMKPIMEMTGPERTDLPVVFTSGQCNQAVKFEAQIAVVQTDEPTRTTARQEPSRMQTVSAIAPAIDYAPQQLV